jgi:hypothetical protein
MEYYSVLKRKKWTIRHEKTPGTLDTYHEVRKLPGKGYLPPGMMPHDCNPSTREAETGHHEFQVR